MLSQKLFDQVVGVLAGIKALFLVYYLLVGWTASVGPWVVPMWLIVFAIVADAYFAWVAFKLAKKR